MLLDFILKSKQATALKLCNRDGKVHIRECGIHMDAYTETSVALVVVTEFKNRKFKLTVQLFYLKGAHPHDLGRLDFSSKGLLAPVERTIS